MRRPGGGPDCPYVRPRRSKGPARVPGPVTLQVGGRRAAAGCGNAAAVAVVELVALSAGARLSSPNGVGGRCRLRKRLTTPVTGPRPGRRWPIGGSQRGVVQARPRKNPPRPVPGRSFRPGRPFHRTTAGRVLRPSRKTGCAGGWVSTRVPSRGPPPIQNPWRQRLPPREAARSGRFTLMPRGPSTYMTHS